MSTTWSKSFVTWFDGTFNISVVFSWDLDAAIAKAASLKNNGFNVRIGGPAVYLNRQIVPRNILVQEKAKIDVLRLHNPEAVFTTRGCIRNCTFCAVPKIEGEFRELSDDEWTPKRIVCDNNFLASSNKHFDNVIHRLIESKIVGIDFNQGLDARLLNKQHATKLALLPNAMIRFAFDYMQQEKYLVSAISLVKEVGIKKDCIRVYVLIGFNDTPEDALYRLEKVRSFGLYPNPMRYQPLDAKRKNEYVASGWTDTKLKTMCRYYSRLNWLGKIPFEEFDNSFRRKYSLTTI